MGTTYAFQRGKYGGPCGTIFPYFQTLIDLNPKQAEYVDNIPAGYLRCRGQILNAEQYPQLASIIGIGSSCIYRKSGITLQEQTSTGTGGQIQLPDLGSKYITASTTPGNYLNTTTLNTSTNTEVTRAGVAIDLTSNASTTNVISFNYNGIFKMTQRNVPVSGTIRVSAPSSTKRSSVSEGEIMGHGHGSTLSTGRFINNLLQCQVKTIRSGPSLLGCRPDPDGAADTPTGRAWETFTLDISGSDEVTNHAHTGLFPSITGSSSTATLNYTEIPSSGLVTNVTFNKFNKFSIDRISSKFILCEYLIKF
jgi:hypothetical protein